MDIKLDWHKIVTAVLLALMIWIAKDYMAMRDDRRDLIQKVTHLEADVLVMEADHDWAVRLDERTLFITKELKEIKELLK